LWSRRNHRGSAGQRHQEQRRTSGGKGVIAHVPKPEQIGMALSDRQAQMGHGDAGMTMHHTHSDLQRRRAAIERMSDQLMGEVAGSSVN